jgi:hypothetical protein
VSLKRLSGAFLFVSFVLLLGFAAGCGGGGDQQDSGGESQQESSSGGEASGAQGGTGGEGGSDETRIALGRVGAVNLDKNWFILRPTEGERMVFRLREDTRITLGGQEVTPEDIEKGQQAQIEYVVKNERNQAREVTLFAGGGGGGGTGG